MIGPPAVLVTLAAAAGAGGAVSPPAADTGREIVVTAERLAKDQPLVDLDPAELELLGASNLAEVLNSIRAQTRAGSGDSAVVTLLNGRRVASFSEIRDLPPEAIARVEVLSDHAAQRFGFSVGQRVVNFTLRPNFQTQTQEVSGTRAKGAGHRSSGWKAGLLRIDDDRRWQLNGEYERHEALLESERGIVHGDSDVGELARYRTLLPAADTLRISATLSQPLTQAVAASVTANLRLDGSKSLIGLAPGDEPSALSRRSDGRTGELAVRLDGFLGSWRWSATGNYNRSRVVVRSAARIGGERSRTDAAAASTDLLIEGPLGRISDGEVRLSAKAAFERRQVESVNSLGSGELRTALRRSKPSMRLALHVPLAKRGRGVLGTLGDWSVDFNAAAAEVSDFGLLRSFGSLVQWSPSKRLRIAVSAAKDGGAPSMQQLGDARLLSPETPLYDFTHRATVFADLVEGGNDELKPAHRNLKSISLSFRPFDADLSLDARYTITRVRNPIALIWGATAEMETAFPERFRRDAAGRLLLLDARPVNLAESARDELRSSINYTAAPAWLGGARTQSSLVHEWTLRDDYVIRRGGPRLDLFAGSPDSVQDGRARHRWELQSNVLYRGLGGRLTVRSQTGTRVRSSGEISDLHFSALSKVNLRLFADLGHRDALWPTMRWMNSLRVSVDADNLFNSHVDVRDAAGKTPLAYQPHYLDPLGRTLRISIRKLLN